MNARPIRIQTRQKRGARLRGFTLVELLVVVAIIGILVGLLLPAVNAARESGRRTQCANNLRQMALACLSHEEARGILPDGGEWYWTTRTWASPGVPEVAPNQFLGWQYQILPYIDGDALWHVADQETLGASMPPWGNCPTKRRWAVLVDDQMGGTKRRCGADYAGNGGTDGDWADWGHGGNGSDATITWRPNPSDSHRVGGSVTMAKIKNGVSNTLMLGEKCLNLGALPYDQADDDGGWIEGWDFDTIRWGNVQPMADWNQGPIMPINAIRHDGNTHGGRRLAFGSSHVTSFNASLCDGSVRPISFLVNLSNVFMPLCSRNSGRPVNLSAL